MKPGRVNPSAKHATLFIAGGSWKDELADPKTQIKMPGEAWPWPRSPKDCKRRSRSCFTCRSSRCLTASARTRSSAYTFREFLKSGEADWPLLEPMVKSAVRAMDATQESLKKEWGLEVERFTITGASKRGWTTWLTAAADDRVVAIAPMVINMLNMSPHSKLQQASFGGQSSEQIDDYKGLDEYIDTPRGAALRKIVDPWEYRSRLELPKLIILGTNDRYWPLESSNLYWNDLVGREISAVRAQRRPRPAASGASHRRTGGPEPAGHHGQPLPKVDWKYADGRNAEGRGGVRLSVTSDIKPTRVRVWTAKAATRDFRESPWTAVDATAADAGYAFHLAAPSAGYAALLGELVYNEGTETEFSLSTDVRMVGGK